MNYHAKLKGIANEPPGWDFFWGMLLLVGLPFSLSMGLVAVIFSL